MILVPFFEIPPGDRHAKNVKSRCVQIIPWSMAKPTLKWHSSVIIIVIVVVVLRHKEFIFFEKGCHFLANPCTNAEAGDHSEKHFEQAESSVTFRLIEVGACKMKKTAI